MSGCKIWCFEFNRDTTILSQKILIKKEEALKLKRERRIWEKKIGNRRCKYKKRVTSEWKCVPDSSTLYRFCQNSPSKERTIVDYAFHSSTIIANDFIATIFQPFSSPHPIEYSILQPVCQYNTWI